MSFNWEEMNLLARSYLDLQQTRVGCEHRVMKLLQEGASEPIKKMSYALARKMLAALEKKKELSEILKILSALRETLHGQEKGLLKDARGIFKDTTLWDWCKRVRGLGPVAAMTFLGFIDPYVCTSAGKLWAYTGFIPGAKMTSGEKSTWSPHLKGRFWLLCRNVVMARDPYYVPLYQAKKDYYLTQRGYAKYIEDPKSCPKYAECLKRLKGKASRLGKTMKKPPCKGHADNLAKRWLVKLLQSHALEIIRKSLGLPWDAVHHGYIPPKPEDPISREEALKQAVKYILNWPSEWRTASQPKV